MLAVSGARTDGRWRVEITIQKPGKLQPLRFAGEAYSLAFAVAQAVYEAISEGEQVDGTE